ncbi:hypothetical protein CS542_01390 [Pedobacter sp. IW39]|nr:hypothetical protein CS542_01390 [Pedobacter sp. IW39]
MLLMNEVLSVILVLRFNGIPALSSIFCLTAQYKWGGFSQNLACIIEDKAIMSFRRLKER